MNITRYRVKSKVNKIDIVHKIKLIQNAWRKHRELKRFNAALVIQKFVKNKIKDNLAIKQQYNQKINSVIKIQRAVKEWLSLRSTE